MEEKLQQYVTELERSNKELEQFAYVASHDLQEPLRMVSSYTQLLAERYKDKLDRDANDFIGFAVDGAMRMRALINDLLTYSRVNTREQIIKEVDMHAKLGEVIVFLSANIIEKKALITTDDLPVVKADEIQIYQLLQNLISNAMKFCNKEPRIHIGVTEQKNKWEFYIKDNGIGIEEQYKDKIFLIFQRLHTREEYQGTGIGLAICRKIIERHGGKIWFESEKDKGTIFKFTIPKT
jgi:light-regulated signal transduction histidine kinase (bacteriophytochrome)